MQAFLTKTCGCAHGYKGSPCSSTIQVEDIVDCQNNRAELSLAELDLVILRMIHSAINCDQFSYSGRAEKTRQRTRMPFYFHSHRICPKTFLFMHRLHKNRFYSLVKHYRLNRLSLRTHGKKKRLPSSAFSAATIERVVKFIMNVAEDQALLLPGRVPGFKRNWHETAAKLHDKISSLEKLPRCVRCCGTRICWLFKVLWFVDPPR